MKNLFGGYVLTGGKSSRMKRDKAFLEFGGKTLLENAVVALKPNCSQTKIVLNKSQTHFIERLPEDIFYIFDIYENRGAPGGIHAALQNCETEFAIILAVDLPFVRSETIKILAEIALSENLAAVVPRQNDGKVQPLCAVYRVKDCLPEIEEILLKENSPSARNFLEKISTHYVEQNKLANDANLFLNVNLPTDYQNLIDFRKLI